MDKADKTKFLIGRFVVYSAALWSLIFAALHIVWAMGWYIGLREDLAQKAFGGRWFLVYDLTAAGLCLLMVIILLELAQLWRRRLPESLISALVCISAVLLVLRAGAAIVQTLYLTIINKRNFLDVIAFWDLWFCLGAILFSMSVWQLSLNSKQGIRK